FDEIFKTEAFEVDYSSEALINNKKTTYTWYNIFDELVDDVNIIEPIAETHGKFKIKKQGAYYCEITNPEFSDLTLKTNIVGITIPNQKNINIPDKNFKRILIKQKQINANADNEIQESEAKDYKGKIKVYSSEISDLTGIEHFTNITELDCHYNNLKQLDISKNLKLTILNCSSNDLTQLDISKNTKLTALNCKYNKLKISELWKIKSNLPTNCTWDYNAQDNIYDEITEKVGFEIDYSNECIFNNNKTSFVWYNTKDYTKVDENFVKQTAEGKFKFLQLGSYYCKMKNDEFKGLELQTNYITIKNSQTITFELAETAKVNDKIVLNAKTSSKLDVEYNIVSGNATLEGNILTPTKEGVLVVKALQEGNYEYCAVEKEVKIKVSKRNQTITFELADTARVNDKIVLKAKASSKLGVKYKIVSGKATLEGNVLTPTKKGVLVVKALQEGNDEYSAAEKEVSIRILTVGVNSLHKSGIKMYPNPVKEKLFIEL
ncbi:MAG: hypothetical protein MI739_03890, partial [Bacteroidales bacterium]|nr:hypothetical protein [Bacteroidales bacterium]